MDDLKQMMQESLDEWADIDKRTAEREKKDRKIVSIYCSQNHQADVIRTIELLLKFKGMAGHDKDTVEKFQKEYPDRLSVKLINEFLDVKDVYREYLESGGNDDD